jgi:hypothetical protein
VVTAGAAPCPSADFPQADGPATFWLDEQTYLILRAELHGPGNKLAETVKVTGLHYHAAIPASAFRLPRSAPPPSAVCPTVTSLPDLTALRAALAYPPLIPASMPDGLRTGAIGASGAMTSGCKLTEFTITYRDRHGKPAAQLAEAPRSSPSVRFRGRTITIRSGLAGTLSSAGGMTVIWWIQDGLYCSIQSGGVTAGLRLTGVPQAELIHLAASLRR